MPAWQVVMRPTCPAAQRQQGDNKGLPIAVRCVALSRRKVLSREPTLADAVAQVSRNGHTYGRFAPASRVSRSASSCTLATPHEQQSSERDWSSLYPANLTGGPAKCLLIYEIRQSTSVSACFWRRSTLDPLQPTLTPLVGVAQATLSAHKVQAFGLTNSQSPLPQATLTALAL
jgi:hypothetical protein